MSKSRMWLASRCLGTPAIGHLTTQETEDTRALCTHDLLKKVDESDNLTHEQKKKLVSYAIEI
jgi:hypothetical protein